MKNLFSFAIVLAAVAMVSCAGNATQPAAEAAEVVATEVVAATAADSTACAATCDSTAVKAEAGCCAK